MNNIGLKYAYALDENDKSIEVSSALKGENYHCPYCKERMIIKEGQKKRKHFAHYRKTENCSYETYLHSLAKKRIEEWFNTFAVLKIGLYGKQPCIHYDNCIWGEKGTCTRRGLIIYNLKTFYNTIEIEKKYKGFIPDLLLINKDKPNQDPIFIEIYVTHPCSEEKKNSNNRIIEIKINNEEEIDDLIISNLLLESETIKLYNFKPKPQPANFKNNVRLSKVIVYEDMKIERINVTCKSYNNRVEKSIYEITYKNDYGENPSLFGIIKVYETFPNIKNCILCKNHLNNYWSLNPCLLYKNLELPDLLSKKHAYDCSSYEIDNEKIKRCLNNKSNLPFDIWKKD